MQLFVAFICVIAFVFFSISIIYFSSSKLFTGLSVSLVKVIYYVLHCVFIFRLFYIKNKEHGKIIHNVKIIVGRTGVVLAT